MEKQNNASNNETVVQVELEDGRLVDLTSLGPDELRRLHWEQERLFASRILKSPKGSKTRRFETRRGYETVSEIISRIRCLEGPKGDRLGYSDKHSRLLLKLISRIAKKRSGSARVFELGFGSGYALELAANHGCEVFGLDVSPNFVDRAVQKVPSSMRKNFYSGDFLEYDLSECEGKIDLFYWNDVTEHIHPDEIQDYFHRIFSLLRPGGILVTVTPNWHIRPSDITRDFQPPRSEAMGFHLKEYTLGELLPLLRIAGFESASVPLFATRKNVYFLGRGAIGLKRAIEPLLEYLPMPLTRKIVSSCALSFSVARR